MRNKFAKVFLVSLTLLFLYGCYDGTEPDSLGYVVAIGVDRAKTDEEKFNITLQFANPTKISGGASQEGGKGGAEGIENITVTAPSIYSAVNVANHIISKTFVLSHTKLVVFSDEIARAGVEDLLETIGRSSDIRPNTYFAVSKGAAKDFLEAVNPETEINPVRYYTMIFENAYSGFIPKDLSQDFYFYCGSDEKSTVLPMCSVANKEGTDNFSDTGYQYRLEDFMAGDVPSKKQETEVVGMALFQKDKMIGEMGDIETEIYNILTGEYNNSYVTYRYNKTPEDPITVLQKPFKNPKIEVKTDGDVPQILIKISLEADFYSSTPEVAVEDHLDEFSEQISSEIQAEIEKFLKSTQEFGVDIVGFGSYAKRNFLDTKSFSAYGWLEKYPTAKFDVSVDFVVRRTGLVVRSEKK